MVTQVTAPSLPHSHLPGLPIPTKEGARGMRCEGGGEHGDGTVTPTQLASRAAKRGDEDIDAAVTRVATAATLWLLLVRESVAPLRLEMCQ